MAKRKKSGVNKSAAIKDYKAANPDAKPKEIAANLTKKGIDVSAAYISTILSNSKRNSGGTRSTGKKGGIRVVRNTKKRAGRPPAASKGELNIDTLLKVKKLVGDVGGIEEVKAAISTYEKLIAE